MVIFHQGASKLLFKITCLEAIVFLLFAYIDISDGHKTAFSLMSRLCCSPSPFNSLAFWPAVATFWPLAAHPFSTILSKQKDPWLQCFFFFSYKQV